MSQKINYWIAEFEMLYMKTYNDEIPNGKVSEEDIAKWEEENSICLPNYYRLLLSRHDGVWLNSENFFFPLKDVQIIKSGIIVEYICLGSITGGLIWCDQDGNTYLKGKKANQLELIDDLEAVNELESFLTVARDLQDRKITDEWGKKQRKKKNVIVNTVLIIVGFVIILFTIYETLKVL